MTVTQQEPTYTPPTPRQSLTRLVVTVVVIVALCVVAHVTAVLIVVAALVAMIMLHELGHLLAAKAGHMKVTEYFLGFGPRVWSIRRGETEYGIKAIPAGGYVKIIGMTNAEEVDPADEGRTYRQQPFRYRFLVAVAGSAMHGVMAFALLWGLFTFIGQPRADYISVAGFSSLAHHVDPAISAGLEPGDRIVAVDGKAVRSIDDLQHAVEHHIGTPVTVEVERDGGTRRLQVTPQPATTGPTGANGRIGITVDNPTVRSNPLAALGDAGTRLGSIVAGTITGLGHVFSPSGISGYVHDVTNSNAATQSAASGNGRVQSIYGAARTAVQGAQAGAADLILVLVLIIVSVGILNLFPMLPLDGGHVLVAVYERIRSRRGRQYHADVAKLNPVAWAFVMFLGFIVLSSLYLDITHPVKNPFQ